MIISVQTFLPDSSFEKSAQVLDRQRLGKQRVEAWQILNCLTGNTAGWKNHPAVKMWQGYEAALSAYGFFICSEWIKRGYRDSLLARFIHFNKEMQKKILIHETDFIWSQLPWWLGNENFHSSHRQTLLSKNFEHYSQFGWEEKPKYQYWWPIMPMSYTDKKISANA